MSNLVNSVLSLGWSFWIPIFLTVGLAIWNLYQQIRISKLKSEIDKKLLVHRLQFETEFGAYKEIWKGLTGLRESLQFLRPALDPNPGSNYKETIKARVEETRIKANKLVMVIEQNKPFYPPSINDRLADVVKAIAAEILSASDVSESLEYWTTKQTRFAEIHAAIEGACLSIRQRVGTDKG
jgi:hypothetical protein